MECRFLAPSPQRDKNFAFAFVARSICDVFYDGCLVSWLANSTPGFVLSFCISSQLDTQLYISQPMLAWMWTCPTWTWPPCSSINTTSSLEQWPAGCRYTHPHIFLVKVGLLKLLHVVGGLHHGKVFPAWSTNRISQCWIWSGHTSSQSYASSLGLSSWVTCCGHRGGLPVGAPMKLGGQNGSRLSNPEGLA